MTSASLLSRNVVQAIRPATTDRAVFWLTRALVFPLTAIALVLTLAAPALIVSVLLVAYAFIAQLFPGVVIGGVFWTRATKQGMLAGLLTGWAVCGALMLTHHDPVGGVNAGLIGLVANVLVFVAVSVVTAPSGTAQPLSRTMAEIAAETARTRSDRSMTEMAPAGQPATP
jgi:SSS family solute:Na+ symporter